MNGKLALFALVALVLVALALAPQSAEAGRWFTRYGKWKTTKDCAPLMSDYCVACCNAFGKRATYKGIIGKCKCVDRN